MQDLLAQFRIQDAVDIGIIAFISGQILRLLVVQIVFSGATKARPAL